MITHIIAACKYGVVVTFVVAGLSKFIYPGYSVDIVHHILPVKSTTLIIFLIGAVEIIIGASVLILKPSVIGLIAAAVADILFISLSFYAEIFSIDISCGCLGILYQSKLGFSSLPSQISLGVLIVIVYRHERNLTESNQTVRMRVWR